MTRASRSRRRPPALLTVALPACVLVGLLAGCSADSGGGSSASSVAGSHSGAAAGAAAEPARAAGAGAASPDEAGSADAAVPGLSTRRVRTAEQEVRVDGVRPAAERVRQATVALGGLVADERIVLGAEPSSMTLRVPEPRLDQALDEFAAVGTERSRAITSQDVTGTIADLDSRVATQEASVRRVRQLMGRAQKLGDVVLLEGELTKREADLEAARARFRTLDDQATLATVSLTLSPRPAVARRTGSSFASGFAAGWHALRAGTVVLLTALGAVLPWAAVLAVLVVPGLWLYRRASARAPAQPADSSAAP